MFCQGGLFGSGSGPRELVTPAVLSGLKLSCCYESVILLRDGIVGYPARVLPREWFKTSIENWDVS